MTLSNFIIKVNYRLKGTDDDAPVAGDDDWNYWVSVANDKKNGMYDDTKRVWASAYAENSLGNISADDNLSFQLDDTFMYPAKQAYVIDTDGNYNYLDIVKPQERDRRLSTKQVFIAGQNPQTLYFSVPILTGDKLIGGELFLPGYWRPDDLKATSANAAILVDDPNWLVLATAAEIAANDITYEDKFADLNGKANDLYRQMTRKNRRGIYGQPTISPTNVRRITGFRR